MRIRKHAKISPLVYAASSLKPGTVLQPHVCQLNQSPWDVMSFSPPSTPPPPPPPPSQVEGDGVYAGNGSSGHCISVVDRECNGGRQREFSDASAGGTTTDKVEQSEPVNKNERTILCCKTDGKSWHCRREAAKGYSLCEHHISLMKSYNNLAHTATKKPEKPAAEARRRTRPKKASTSSSSNPYEFYYYSGFGPRWGKKRGENCKDNGCSVSKNIEPEHEMEPSALSQFGDEHEFDYVEDEDEDEEDENRENGKKRARKPIKARSLKSLM